MNTIYSLWETKTLARGISRYKPEDDLTYYVGYYTTNKSIIQIYDKENISRACGTWRVLRNSWLKKNLNR